MRTGLDRGECIYWLPQSKRAWIQIPVLLTALEGRTAQSARSRVVEVTFFLFVCLVT